MAFPTIAQRVFEQATKRPDAPAYFVRGADGWVSTNWRTYAREIRMAARALIALGCEPGFTTTILGFNRPEWVVFDIATMAAGGAPAGIYTTNSPTEVKYITGHCEAKVILVENKMQYDKVAKVRDELPDLEWIVLMAGAEKVSGKNILSWEDFLAKGERVSDDTVDKRIAGIDPDSLATLIYTSGTTGPPKGVMLSHRNLTWTADAAMSMTGITPDDCTLSYLPLSHIAEQMFSIHGPVSAGFSVYFAQSMDLLRENLVEVQPTVFFGVPRVWEKFYSGITSKIEQASDGKKKLLGWAMGVGTKVSDLKNRGQEPTGLLKLQYALASKLVFSKLKAAVGLGRVKMCVSGAAPIGAEVLEFFGGVDVRIHEVYGQSEGSGPSTFNVPGRTQLGTVGPVIPGAELRIGDDGEVLVKGANIFLGYFKDVEATNEALSDGWLHSGDLGEVDARGFLTITGRKKDIIITAGGKNIAPKNIENDFKHHQLINEAVVIGDRRKFLSALLTLDPDTSAEFAAKHGLKVEEMPQSPIVIEAIQKHLDEMNSHYARVEQVKKFVILPRNFTIDDGELTPTLKIKRAKVNDGWTEVIEGIYAEIALATQG
jgi:long-chain acyl-CoA synthetase